MEELGCLGVEEAGSTPLSNTSLVKARLFFPALETNPEDARFETQALRARLEAQCAGHLQPKPEEIRLELLPDEDWGAAWRRFFHRVRITDRVYCGPPWESELPSDAAEGAFVIAIDPGQAFGTGTHDTTQLCLRLMEQQVKAGAVVFDVGAGSGILSIAAVKLGASHALGMEYDPVCRENFQLNLGLNGVEGAATFLESGDPAAALRMTEAQRTGSPALTVCNMLSVRFLPLLPALREVGAPLILSGFLTSETEQIRQEAERAGFRIESSHQQGEWGAFICSPA
jgi:ribosomal protein L11 methyltransferase